MFLNAHSYHQAVIPSVVFLEILDLEYVADVLGVGRVANSTWSVKKRSLRAISSNRFTCSVPHNQ